MKPLRLLPLLVIFCCLFTTTRAQYVTIPDTAFVSWLQQNYPTCMNGNQMDTTCAGIARAFLVNVGSKNISNLYGVQFFDSLTYLDCSRNLLSSLPPLPSKLKQLIAFENTLTTLPPIPDSLATLRVNNNRLTNLPALPITLTFMECGANQITSLPAMPALLKTLTCSNNQLTTLPVLPDSLNRLECSYNSISALPSLPSVLVNLIVSHNPLTVLPALPSTLQMLHMDQCYITSISALPPVLRTLICNDNLLTSLPTLPLSLKSFTCDYNQLTSLPSLPAGLNRLLCRYNLLTTLPSLPDSLFFLWCRGNNLSSLPTLPDSLSFFDCGENPALYCLPRLTHIGALVFDSSNITCLPNYGVVYNSEPNISRYQLCTPDNANGCQIYWNISGKVFKDSTGNCQQDTGEANPVYMKVKLYQAGNVIQQTYTTAAGVYAFEQGKGNYTLNLDTAGLPFVVTCPVGGVNTVTLIELNSQQTRDFALQCKQGFDIGTQSISSNSIFRPARFNVIKIKAGDVAQFYRQNCNTFNLAGQLVTTITGQLRYVSPAPGALVPTSVLGNTINYTIADWSAIDPETAFNIITQTDTTAQSGTFACFDVTVSPTAGDNYPQNNSYKFCFPMVTSFDPNDKAVYPVSNVDITGDKWLTYTVRFQNTGNAPAEHIYIADTIDTDVDIETFQLLAYSFQPQVIIKGNAVRFNFANINLPDSVNDEPNSHGYVQYKVKVKDNATVGTVINNTAFIYFDFNAPVVTNTTTNTLTLPNGINTIANSTATMQLYPNPANEVVMINLSDNLTGCTLTLSDVTGRSLNALPVVGAHSQISTANLSSGVYLITAVKGGERVVQRLVVSH